MKASRSIRVNFRFGPRTDPELMREIANLPPYRRARLLRKLLEIGWRARTDPPRHTGAPPFREHAVAPVPASQPDDADLSQDVLGLLGESVRI